LKNVGNMLAMFEEEALTSDGTQLIAIGATISQNA